MESTKEILKELEDIAKRLQKISDATGKNITLNSFVGSKEYPKHINEIYIRSNDDSGKYIEKMYYGDSETEWEDEKGYHSFVDLDTYNIYT